MKKLLYLSFLVFLLLPFMSCQDIFTHWPFTTTTTTIVKPSSLNNKTELAAYLGNYWSTCNTSYGSTNFTFDVSENTSIHSPYDIWIWVSYDVSFFQEIADGIAVSTDMNHPVLNELKEFQEQLAKDVISKMPSKKLWGGYHFGYYTYPSIHQGWHSYSYYSWANFAPLFGEYANSSIIGFYWTPAFDDDDLWRY